MKDQISKWEKIGMLDDVPVAHHLVVVDIYERLLEKAKEEDRAGTLYMRLISHLYRDPCFNADDLTPYMDWCDKQDNPNNHTHVFGRGYIDESDEELAQKYKEEHTPLKYYHVTLSIGIHAIDKEHLDHRLNKMLGADYPVNGVRFVTVTEIKEIE